MSSLALPATLDSRLRAIHKRRHAAQFAELVHLGAWFVGVAAAAGMAAAALIGSR